MKHKTKRLLSWLLALAMVFSLMPGMGLTALAWDGDPYASLLNTTTVVTFDGKGWYLIEDNSTAANAGTVTLLSKECVGASAFGSNTTYGGSTVETYVNNWYSGNISTNAKTMVSGGMFLLTLEQANTIANANSNVLKCEQPAGAYSNRWWLSTPGQGDNCVSFVYGWGEVWHYGEVGSYSLGVRPALQLDLSKVSFDSTSNTFMLPPVTGVNLNKTEAALTVGGKETLTATVEPGAADQTVTWSSSNTDIATVDDNGEVTAVAPGYATITATSSTNSSQTATCRVTVTWKDVTLQEGTYTVTIGGTTKLGYDSNNQLTYDGSGTTSWQLYNALGHDRDSSTECSYYLLGTLEDKNVCLDASGWLRDDTASGFVVVNSGDQQTYSNVGASAMFRVSDQGYLYTMYDHTEPRYGISGPACFAVYMQDGKLVYKKYDGTDGLAIFKFELSKDITALTLDPPTATLGVGEKETLTASLVPADAPNNTIIWSSDNESVATVVDGVVTGVSAGSATITATATNGTAGTNDDKTASCAVTVSPATVADVDGTPYTTLEAAFKAAATGTKTVKLLADVEINSKITPVTRSNAVVTLDLNGNTITATADSTADLFVFNRGKLIVKDTSAEQTGEIVGEYGNTARRLFHVAQVDVAQAGTLEIDGGKFTVNSTNEGAMVVYVHGGEGTPVVDVKGGSFKCNYNGNDTGSAVTISKTGKLNVTGGTIESNGITIKMSGNTPGASEVNVNGGTVKSTASHAVYVAGGTLTVTDGRIESTAANAVTVKIKSASGGNAVFNGGTIVSNGNTSVFASTGSASINNGCFEGKVFGNEEEESGTPTITGTLNITGGYFSKPPVANANGVTIAAGKVIMTNSGDNKAVYPYAVGEAAARISEMNFDSLEAAVAYANNKPGKTITLLKNTEIDGSLDIHAKMTLDLNGKTLKGGVDVYGNVITITDSSDGQKGVIEVKDWGVYLNDEGAGLVFKGGTITGTPTQKINNTITAVKGATVTIDGGTVDAKTAYGIAIFNESKVYVNSGTVQAMEGTGSTAISSNGNAENNGLIKIRGGTVKASEAAIYCPSGTLIVSGGDISGYTGIYFKSMNLTITGGTIKGTGAIKAYEYTGNGYNATGDALVIDSCGYPNGIEKVRVTGGTFESEKNAPVACYNRKNNIPVLNFISGGTFNKAPDATYIATGKEAKASDATPTTYTIGAKTAHTHNYVKDAGHAFWSWEKVANGNWTASVCFTCAECGERSQMYAATVATPVVNGDDKTRTWKATYGNLDSTKVESYVAKVKVELGAGSVTVQGTGTYNYGSIAHLSAAQSCDWKIDGKDFAKNATEIWVPAKTTDGSEKMTVTATAAADETLVGSVVMTGENLTEKVSLIATYRLPDGAQVTSAVMYRGFTDAGGNVVNPKTKDFKDKIQSTNGRYTLNIKTSLTDKSYGGFAVIEFKLGEESYVVKSDVAVVAPTTTQP